MLYSDLNIIPFQHQIPTIPTKFIQRSHFQVQYSQMLLSKTGLKAFYIIAELSPRSAAVYTRKALKEAAKKRRRRKKKKKAKKDEKDHKKKKKRRRSKKKKRPPVDGQPAASERADLRPAPVEHFYPTPHHLMKKRCLFVTEAKPVVCSICDGIHYRTRRNFKANLRVSSDRSLDFI